MLTEIASEEADSKISAFRDQNSNKYDPNTNRDISDLMSEQMDLNNEQRYLLEQATADENGLHHESGDQGAHRVQLYS